MKYHLTKHLATIPAFKSSNLLLSTFTGWLTNHASRWLSPSRVGYHTDSPITLQHLLYSRCWFSKLVRDPNTNNIPWFWLRGACGVQNLTPLQNHVVNMFWNVWRQFANLSGGKLFFVLFFVWFYVFILILLLFLLNYRLLIFSSSSSSTPASSDLRFMLLSNSPHILHCARSDEICTFFFPSCFPSLFLTLSPSVCTSICFCLPMPHSWSF